MKSQNKRYVFITYADLRKIKFKKLERVCSKVYILIDAVQDHVQFSLVQQTQNFGKNVKWIPVQNTNQDLAYHLSFLMGQLHEKVNKDIEFAILSNDSSYDSLVDFINVEGRSCIRVKRKKTKVEQAVTESVEQHQHHINGAVEFSDVKAHTYKVTDADIDNYEEELYEDESYEEETYHEESYQDKKEAYNKSEDLTINEVPTFSSLEKLLVESPVIPEKHIIEQTARETVKRLIRSGNRPSDVSLLKSYILLHNQEVMIQGNIDKIIHRLQETKEINVENQEVVYNF